MKHWNYSGRSQQGEMVTGQLEHSNAQAVARELIHRGITPVTISAAVSLQQNSLTGIAGLWVDRLRKNKRDDEQLILFCQQMHRIYKSGLPIVDGLQTILADSKSPVFRRYLADMIVLLKQGYSLSSAMTKHSAAFNPLMITMVRVGEGSGQLAAVFEQLGGYIEKSVEIKKSLWSGFRYPLFVLVSIVLAMIVVNLYVVPAFGDLFSQSEAPMPWPTLVLLFFSGLLINYGFLLLLAVCLLLAAFIFWQQSPAGKKRWHQIILNLPILGGLLYKSILARYARAFSLMIRVKVPLQECLYLSQQVTGNDWLADKIQTITRGVERGESLYLGHSKTQMFPPLVLQMIHTGEKTGSLSILMSDIADAYERDVAYELKNLSVKIEPVLIVFLSLLVGVLALGIFLPMWDLLSISR